MDVVTSLLSTPTGSVGGYKVNSDGFSDFRSATVSGGSGDAGGTVSGVIDGPLSVAVGEHAPN